MLFTGMEQFEKAKNAFNLCIELPVMEIHEIQLEAAKKLVLLTYLTSKH